MVLVVRGDLPVGRDDGVEEVRKDELDRRRVVDRPDAHRQEVIRGLRSFLSRPFGADRCAVGVERDQTRGPHRQEGSGNGRNEDLTTSVRLAICGIVEVGRGRRQGDGTAERVATRALLRGAELLGETEQRTVRQGLG